MTNERHEFKALAIETVPAAPPPQTRAGYKACRFCRHDRPVKKVLVAPPGRLKKPWPRKMWVCEECGEKFRVSEEGSVKK